MMRLLPALLMVGCLGSDADTADSGAESYERVLVDETYRFCHVDGADAKEAQKYCALVSSPPDGYCPGLEATCGGADEGDVADLDDLATGCGGAPGAGGEEGLAAPPEKPSDPFKVNNNTSCDPPSSGPEWMSALVRWLAAAFVALVVLLVIRLVLRYVGTGASTTAAPKVQAVRKDTVEVHEDVPDKPSRDILADARQALAEGRFADAVLLARGASLRALADHGYIRLHRAKTDREYRRQLRREPGVHEPLAEVFEAVEAHRWGGNPTTESRARSVLGAAERLIALVMPALLLVVLIGAAGDRYRYGPDGDAGIYDVFDDYGYEVSWRLRGLDSVDVSDADALVLDATRVTPTSDDWKALRAYVNDGGVLIVAGDASAGFSELGTWGLTQRGALSMHDGVSAYAPQPVFPAGPRFAYDQPAGVSWVSDSGDAVIQSYQLGQGAIVAIADEQLMRNGSLVHPDNEIFWGTLLWVGPNNGWWTIDDPFRVQMATMTGTGADNPVASLFNANILPFVLQLLFFMALGALWLGWPFKPLRDPPDEGRQRFADHLVALGGRWESLGASRFAASRYAQLWLSRLGRGGLMNAAMRHGMSADEARVWVDGVENLAETPDDRSSSRDIEQMEELWTITRPKG